MNPDLSSSPLVAEFVSISTESIPMWTYWVQAGALGACLLLVIAWWARQRDARCLLLGAACLAWLVNLLPLMMNESEGLQSSSAAFEISRTLIRAAPFLELFGTAMLISYLITRVGQGRGREADGQPSEALRQRIAER